MILKLVMYYVASVQHYIWDKLILQWSEYLLEIVACNPCILWCFAAGFRLSWSELSVHEPLPQLFPKVYFRLLA